MYVGVKSCHWCSPAHACLAMEHSDACVVRRRQSKPSNTHDPTQRATQHRTTARSSANLTMHAMIRCFKLQAVEWGLKLVEA